MAWEIVVPTCSVWPSSYALHLDYTYNRSTWKPNIYSSGHVYHLSFNTIPMAAPNYAFGVYHVFGLFRRSWTKRREWKGSYWRLLFCEPGVGRADGPVSVRIPLATLACLFLSFPILQISHDTLLAKCLYNNSRRKLDVREYLRSIYILLYTYGTSTLLDVFVIKLPW